MSYYNNPVLNLTFTSDIYPSSVSVGSEYIIRGSITLKKNLLSGLNSASDRATLSLYGNAEIVQNIIKTEGDIRAVLVDGTETLFTGYLSTKYSWGVTDSGETSFNITIEDVGTRLLEKVFVESGQHFFDTQANEVIDTVVEKAGVVTAQTMPSIVDEVTCLVEEGTTCKEILSELLYELGYVYYFDNYGEMNLYKIDCSSIVGLRVANSDNLVVLGGDTISVTKNIRKYKGARVTYERFGQAENYLVYRNTTGQNADEGHPYCYMEMKGGECFDGGEVYKPKEGETRTDYLIEGVNAASETDIVGSNEIVAVTEITEVITSSATTHITANVTTEGGKYLKVSAENGSSITDYLTRLDAYGTITYVRDTNVVRTTASDTGVLEEELSWVHNDEKASEHANLITSYYKYAEATYTFYSLQDFNQGEIVRLNDDVHTGLDVNVLITAKNYTDGNDYFEYSAVAVSVFDLDRNTIKQTFAIGKRLLKGENGVSGVTYGLDSTVDVIKSPSSTSVPTTSSVTITPWVREGYSPARPLVCDLKLEATSNYGSSDESWTTVQEVTADILTFAPTYEYEAYKITMTYRNEIVATKTIPYVYDGATAPVVNLDVSRTDVDYYADNVVVDDSPILITVHSDRLCALFINGYKVKESQQLIEYEITPSDYLDSSRSISISATASYAQATETIRKNTYQGELSITSAKQHFEYYADNVPHNDTEVITVSVSATGYKQYPKLNIDGVAQETPDEYSYEIDIPVSLLQDKEFIWVQTTIFDRSERLQISKITDVGKMNIVAAKYQFEYYADNYPHNSAETIEVSISQSGYSGMPDLYVRGQQESYVNGKYYLPATYLKMLDTCILEIRKGEDSESIEVAKVYDVASVNLQLDEKIVYYTYDNERLSGNVGFTVNYSGLYLEPTVEADETTIETTEGRGEVPISMFDNAETVTVRAYSPTVYYAYDLEIITKEKEALNLSFYLSAGQFNYGSNNEISPSEIIVTNTTTGISDPESVELYVGVNKVEWVDGKYTITPDMVEGRYLEVRITYDDEERSAIITKTYDGKTLTLSADSPFFRLDSTGNLIDGQTITLTVHSSGLDEDIVWTNNKGLSIPNNTMEYEVVPTDTTPYTFTVTSGELSDTFTINFVRDGRDGASAGTYLGPYKQDPTTKPDGSPLANGDYYLNINDPTQPIPYKYLDGQWYAVTSDDPDWSLIASTTQNDVSKYCTNILSTNSYYGFFELLASNKAVINTLGTQEIIIRDDGSITSESFIESNGLEGFQINDEGITANKGTWRGSFANGLTFVPETSVKIPKEMTQADAYKAIRAANIADGTYYEGSNHDSEPKLVGENDEAFVLPTPPAFFAPYTNNVLGMLNMVDNKVRYKDNATSYYYEVARGTLISAQDTYLFGLYSAGWGNWLLVTGTRDTSNPNMPCKTTNVYLLTAEKLAQLLSANAINFSGDILSYSKVINITNYELPKYDACPSGLGGNVQIFVDDEITNTTWLYSGNGTVSAQRMLSNREEFDVGTSVKVSLLDGTVLTQGIYFIRPFVGNHSYFRIVEVDGEKFAEAGLTLMTSGGNFYALARSQDMINWSTVVEIPYDEFGNAIKNAAGKTNAAGYGPLDFMLDKDGNILFNARVYTIEDSTNTFFTGIYNIATETASVLPNTLALFPVDSSDSSPYAYPNTSSSVYTAPIIYKYPLVVINDVVYGSNQGLNFFSYDLNTKVYTDLTWVFNEIKIGRHMSDGPEEFFLDEENINLINVALAADTPDLNAIYMAPADLVITGLTGHDGKVYVTFLYKKEMTILGEYDTTTGKIQFITMNSPSCPYVDIHMIEQVDFYEEDGEERMNFVANGVMNFTPYNALKECNGYTYTVDNLNSEELLDIGRPVERPSNVLRADVVSPGAAHQPASLGSFIVNDNTFIINGSTYLGLLTLDDLENNRSASVIIDDTSVMAMAVNPAMAKDKASGIIHFFLGTYHLKFNADGELISYNRITIDGADPGSDTLAIYGYTTRATLDYIDGKMYVVWMIDNQPLLHLTVSEDGDSWTTIKTFDSNLGTDFAMYYGGVEVNDSSYKIITQRAVTDGSSSDDADIEIVGVNSSDEIVVLDSASAGLGAASILCNPPSIQKKDGVYYIGSGNKLFTYSNGQLTEVTSVPYFITNFEFVGDKIIILGGEVDMNITTAAIIHIYEYSDGTIVEKSVVDNVYPYGGGFTDIHETSDGDYLITLVGYEPDPSNPRRHLSKTVLAAGTERFIYKDAGGLEKIQAFIEEGYYGYSYLSLFYIPVVYQIYTLMLGGAYDFIAPLERAIRNTDKLLEFTSYCICDSCVVDIREVDDKLEIRLLPLFRYSEEEDYRSSIVSYFPAPTESATSNYYYLSNVDAVKPFLVIDKNSQDPVGTTFYWNFPAQLTTSFEQNLRAPIIKDGAINSGANAAIPDDFIIGLVN